MAKCEKLKMNNVKRKYSALNSNMSNLQDIVNMQVKIEEKDKNFGSYKLLSKIN
jgi:hypothetical protein